MRQHLLNLAIGLVCLVVAVQSAGCSATRATVHEEDMKKVFPWPSREDTVVIQVRPQTTMANMCVWFGSWEDVEVTEETTFYIKAKTGRDFAYTPSRSPIGRLAEVVAMEIRWPQKMPDQAASEAEGSTEEGKQGEEKKGEQEKPPANSKAGPSKAAGQVDKPKPPEKKPVSESD
ncbi:MAG: hypothetical protein JRJ19_03640 [Deltaproteobacteria bacterium]|nr:hypothetical protein [Deltaproteobacteria bacterium]MBW1871129.1 hypothetical protein [Deltaproteobacteria bacterium]